MNIRGDAYLINYTRRNVFVISFVISVIIFAVIDFSIIQIAKAYERTNNNQVVVENEVENIEIMKNSKSKAKKEKTEEDDLWQIEIPKIKLIAPIAEGTSQDVMMEYVGHFEETSKWKGNVGLAAHNRGYPINYFAKVKELKKGDKIVYKTKNGKKIYSVILKKVIKDTDWSYLEKTKENKITLITCVEDEPSKRLCVQAVQIKEE